MCSSSLAGGHKRGGEEEEEKKEEEEEEEGNRRCNANRPSSSSSSSSPADLHSSTPNLTTTTTTTTTVTLTVLVDARLQISASRLDERINFISRIDGWMDESSRRLTFTVRRLAPVTDSTPQQQQRYPHSTSPKRISQQMKRRNKVAHYTICNVAPPALPACPSACFEDEQHLDVVRTRNDTARINFQIALAHSTARCGCGWEGKRRLDQVSMS